MAQRSVCMFIIHNVHIQTHKAQGRPLLQ
jgi:hypothetical protein